MGRKTELEGDEEVQSDVTAERYLKVALQKANSNFKSVFGTKNRRDKTLGIASVKGGRSLQGFRTYDGGCKLQGPGRESGKRQ